MFHDDFNFGHWSILSLFLIFYIYFKKKEFKKLEIHPKNDSRGKKFSGIGLRVGSFFIWSKVCGGDNGIFFLKKNEKWIWCKKCRRSKIFLIVSRPPAGPYQDEKTPIPWCKIGYIYVGDKCWRRNALASILRCWWRSWLFWSPASTVS